jgi:hypothetical protein
MNQTFWRSAGRVAACATLLVSSLNTPAIARDGVSPYAAAHGGSQRFQPKWALQPALQRISLRYDANLTPQQNGARLKQIAQALPPGTTLLVGPGQWSVDSYFALDAQGTPLAPIRIVGAPGGGTVITRSDPWQNIVNLGSGAPARYLALIGLEFTGGDTALRLYDASHVWIDRCKIHHVAGVGVSANTHDTERIFLTRNEVSFTNDTGEGFYLGANDGVVAMKDSVIAFNHVHDTGGWQGDGIELKQGSYNNWIVGNVVHDTPYPAILAYGTDGRAPNVIEHNVCYRSGDNVMQVQGEALVRNNLLMGGVKGFASHDHQGLTRDLVVVHNTILTGGRGADLSSWGGRPGMVFANNVVYSAGGDAVRFNHSGGVALGGNYVLGSILGAPSNVGFSPGVGLTDFVDASWDGSHRNAHPRFDSVLIGHGDPGWTVPLDLSGQARSLPVDPGCYDGR